MRDLPLVQSVIRSVIAATHLPVTVKIRSGWSEETRDPVSIALRCQDAGAKALALHPRTRTQMFTGAARWDEIALVVDALEIPVIGNGDIKTEEDVLRMWNHTKCAGLMVARGAFGQPWIFDRARALIEGKTPPPVPGIEERFEIAIAHAKLAQSFEPDRRGAAFEFRKHLGWYVKGLHNSADLRRRLHSIESLSEIEGIFRDYLSSVDVLESDREIVPSF